MRTTIWLACGVVCLLSACASSFPPPTGPVRVWKPNEPMKVAVFPVFEGNNLAEVPEVYLQQIISSVGAVPNTTVSHSWYPDMFEGASLTKDPDIAHSTLVGARALPDVPFLIKKGKELGTDAVLVFSAKIRGELYPMRVRGWMVAVGSGRIVQINTSDTAQSFSTGTRILLLRTREGD